MVDKRYEDIGDYFPLNSTVSYAKLIEAATELVDELNAADTHLYNTRIARIRLKHLWVELGKMNSVLMCKLKLQPKPWEKLGISAEDYFKWRE